MAVFRPIRVVAVGPQLRGRRELQAEVWSLLVQLRWESQVQTHTQGVLTY